MISYLFMLIDDQRKKFGNNMLINFWFKIMNVLNW